MENSSEIFELIFNRKLEDAATKNYLEQLTAAHPYFSPAQFYLLLRTKKDDAAYDKQVQKTSALFNNNYWLNYLLISYRETGSIFSEAEPGDRAIKETIADLPVETTMVTGVPETTEPSAVLSAQPETAPGSDMVTHDATIADTPAPEETLIPEEEAPVKNTSEVENETVPFAADELPAEPAGDANTAAITTLVNTVTDQYTNNTVQAEKNEPSPEPLLFQPLHTSDYFASVGIKLSEEVNANDRLGKQLRSFTQWLKTMKKIDAGQSGQEPGTEAVPEKTDQNIQTLAEISNKEDEIITEAMADVLVQQGRISKAVEVLKKLSLLNPSKSPYFAAKIEQLKD